LLNLKNQAEFHQTKLQLSSKTFENSTYNVIEKLKVNDKQIFKSMDNRQRNDAMLSCFLFPNCLVQNPGLKKSKISPSSLQLPPIVADLSSQCSIRLSLHILDHETNEFDLETIAELCEIRRSSQKLDNLVKYDKLQKAADELMFCDFSWCPEVIGSDRFIACLTLSRTVVFFSISGGNEVTQVHSEMLDKTVNLIKWTRHGKDQFLFVNGEKGGLVRHSIVMQKGKVTGLTKIEERQGQLKIPITELESWSEDSSIVIAVKSHSLEIFSRSKSFVQYIGLSVTGITSVSCSSPEFLITTLDNEVHHLRLSDDGGSLLSFSRVSVLNSQMNQDKFRAHGIAASKNKVLIYMALYPATANDHLTLKQPIHISINQFSPNDPYKLLLENESLRLTDYHDCVELVRFVGSSNMESMVSLTAMNYDIGLTADFAYYLKIQLLVTKAKLTFYKTRSETVYEVTNERKQSIEKIIEVISAYCLLKNFVPKKNQSNLSQLSIRCLSNFIAGYVAEDIQSPPFNQAHAAFKEDLVSVLNKAKARAGFKGVEMCYYCDSSIEPDNLTCTANHQPPRCPITKLQLTAATSNRCSRCDCSVIDRVTLKEVTGKDDSTCIYCDGHFIFNP
jgi:hypothetical protein